MKLPIYPLLGIPFDPSYVEADSEWMEWEVQCWFTIPVDMGESSPPLPLEQTFKPGLIISHNLTTDILLVENTAIRMQGWGGWRNFSLPLVRNIPCLAPVVETIPFIQTQPVMVKRISQVSVPHTSSRADRKVLVNLYPEHAAVRYQDNPDVFMERRVFRYLQESGIFLPLETPGTPGIFSSALQFDIEDLP